MRIERWRLESVVMSIDDDEETIINTVDVMAPGTLVAFEACTNPACPVHMIVISGDTSDDTLAHSIVYSALVGNCGVVFNERVVPE